MSDHVTEAKTRSENYSAHLEWCGGNLLVNRYNAVPTDKVTNGLIFMVMCIKGDFMMNF